MKGSLKTGVALALLLSLGSTAFAADWTSALEQLAKQVPSVRQVLQTGETKTTPETTPTKTDGTAGATTKTDGTAGAGTKAEKPAPEKQASHLEVVLLLDKSGSMKGLEQDTIKGYNDMLAKERKLTVPTNVTTVLFSSDREVLVDRQPIADVPDMTEDMYKVRGATSLYDTIGAAIDTTSKVKDIEVAGSKVLFVIITDGLENYSQDYDQDKVKELIKAQEEKGWEFVFIGANMDAEKEAGTIGIKEENAATYDNSKEGVQANYKAVSQMMHSLATTSSLVGSPWKNSIVRGR